MYMYYVRFAYFVHVYSDAVEAMTRVANYLNEMQRVSETYSALFDTILRESGGVEVSQPATQCNSTVTARLVSLQQINMVTTN